VKDWCNGDYFEFSFDRVQLNNFYLYRIIDFSPHDETTTFMDIDSGSIYTFNTYDFLGKAIYLSDEEVMLRLLER